jgi:hypothetical protein
MNEKKQQHIVLLEDDRFQREDFKMDLESTIPGVRVEPFSCGAEFLDAYEVCPVTMPDLFVIDLMLDWCKPWVKTERQLPNPPPSQEETALLCYRAVRKYASNVPIIIWTITNMQVPFVMVDAKKTFHLRKDRAIEGDFCNLIRRILSSH